MASESTIDHQVISVVTCSSLICPLDKKPSKHLLLSALRRVRWDIPAMGGISFGQRLGGFEIARLKSAVIQLERIVQRENIAETLMKACSGDNV